MFTTAFRLEPLSDHPSQAQTLVNLWCTALGGMISAALLFSPFALAAAGYRFNRQVFRFS